MVMMKQRRCTGGRGGRGGEAQDVGERRRDDGDTQCQLARSGASARCLSLDAARVDSGTPKASSLKPCNYPLRPGAGWGPDPSNSTGASDDAGRIVPGSRRPQHSLQLQWSLLSVCPSRARR
jgi:hypothetical protein